MSLRKLEVEVEVLKVDVEVDFPEETPMVNINYRLVKNLLNRFIFLVVSIQTAGMNSTASSKRRVLNSSTSTSSNHRTTSRYICVIQLHMTFKYVISYFSFHNSTLNSSEECRVIIGYIWSRIFLLCFFYTNIIL